MSLRLPGDSSSPRETPVTGFRFGTMSLSIPGKRRGLLPYSTPASGEIFSGRRPDPPGGGPAGAGRPPSSSYAKQHMSRPHMPEIFEGLSERFWFLAIRIVTGWNPFKKVEQQRVSPQGPR